MAVPVAPFVGIGKQTVLNMDQIVWIRRRDDEGVTVGLSAPGPDGKHLLEIPPGEVARAILVYVTEHVQSR